jgi:hypothetical protein
MIPSVMSIEAEIAVLVAEPAIASIRIAGVT